MWTVGHSNHPIEHFVVVLRSVPVEVLVDVRSQPFVRYSVQFNQEPLRQALEGAGIRYLFLGRELGGRPADLSLYDEDGHVLYGDVARTPDFERGVERLVEGARRFRVAMMCSEEDPTHCHRRLLVGRVLRAQGVDVVHVRGDGTQQSEDDLLAEEAEPVQGSLFGEEQQPWKSIRSVSPSTRPRSSSNP